MNIGFTGTRNGMTDKQRESFTRLLNLWRAKVFRHGACVGADADAVIAVRATLPDCRIIAHPGQPANGGENEHLSHLAINGSDETLPAKGHFARNRDIVEASDGMIATPWQNEPQPAGTGGGTWYTIQYAQKAGKPVMILWSDGRVEQG